MTTETLEQTAAGIANSKKYRAMGIPLETILDLLEKEIEKHPKKSQAIKNVKTKLHNITAPYLDRLDYIQAAEALELAFEARDRRQVKKTCLQFLQAHQSTEERIPYLHKFYRYVFRRIGEQCSLLWDHPDLFRAQAGICPATKHFLSNSEEKQGGSMSG